LETKGDDRDNSDSEAKNRLGRDWANEAGKDYRYFMVFENGKYAECR
jgi:type III restriction enzyme